MIDKEGEVISECSKEEKMVRIIKMMKLVR